MQVFAEQDQRTDEELITAINAGETAAFDVLYFRYRDWVANLAWRFTGSHQHALDVLQETFLYFSKKFPGFDLTCQFKSFLYPVVKHASLAMMKKEQRFENDDTHLENLESRQESACNVSDDLSVVLNRLAEEHREVLLLRFVDGMKMGEISDSLKIPTGTVKSRLHNALKILRDDPKTKKIFFP